MPGPNSNANRLRALRQAGAPSFPPLTYIHAEKLFGKYDYKELKVFGASSEAENIAFLYGENGVGKTTVLRLLYSLLSSQQNGGHRSALGKAKFKSFGVTFADGQSVYAARTGDQLSGAYQYIFEGPRVNDRVDIWLNPDGKVASSPSGGPQVERIWSNLDKIVPTLVFVNDNRTIRSTYDPWDVRAYLNQRLRFANTQNRVDPRTDVDAFSELGLEHLLSRAHALFVNRAILGSVRADTEIGQVYLEIAKTISRPYGQTPRPIEDALNDFIHRTDQIGEFQKEFGQLKLVPSSPISEIVQIVSRSSKNKAQLIEILDPYISSLAARIEANRELAKQMAAFENGVNSFLRRKRMYCRLDSPIHFIDEDGVKVDSGQLSSGERHLLYLCCASLLSWERQSIILVDEPELSLNYKWQRILVSALLRIAGHSAQFVMATHSFEIISRYKEATIDLEPTN